MNISKALRQQRTQDWGSLRQTIPALTFVNGVPVPEADELFFTRDLPDSATTVTMQYRAHANGNPFGAGSITLAGVGGPNEVANTVTINDGSESATIEMRWYPSSRQIRVSVTERVFQGLPTINDVEVILSYTETRTIPATDATTREVDLEFEHPGGQVFAIKPSSGGNLILVGDRQEIDTGYSYDTLFGSGNDGFLTTPVTTATYLDYEDFAPIPATITDLENHMALPDFGLFTTVHTVETDLNIPVTIKPQGFDASDLPTTTPTEAGKLWNDNGTPRITT